MTRLIPFNPTLAPISRRATEWRERFPSDNNLRITICWQGNPGYRADANCSIPLEAFSPATTHPNIQLINLQPGDATKDLAFAFVPDWRWGLSDTDTNCYPSMKLYLQPQHGDWAGVFEKTSHDLKER